MRATPVILAFCLTTAVAGPPWVRRPAIAPATAAGASSLTLKDSKTNDSNNTANGVKNTAARTYLASKWTAGSSYSLAALETMGAKGGAVGNPTGEITCYVYSNGSSAPGTLLGTSDTVAASSYPAAASPAWIRFTFPTPVSLTSGTVYWHVFTTSAGVDANNYVTSIAPDTFVANGIMISSNAVDWAVSTSRTLKLQTYAP